MASEIRPGQYFEHTRYIIGSPKAGTSRPDVCRITKVTRWTVYYRTENGMLMSAARDSFICSVLRFRETTTNKEN